MIDEFLTKRVTVQRAPQPTSAPTGLTDTGAAERIYSTLASGVPFAIWARGGSFRQREFGLGRAADMGGATFYAMLVGDRIVDGADTWEVTFVSRPQNAFYQCDLAMVAIT